MKHMIRSALFLQVLAIGLPSMTEAACNNTTADIRPIYNQSLSDTVTKITAGSDGKLFFAAQEYGSLHVFDTASPKPIVSISYSDYVSTNSTKYGPLANSVCVNNVNNNGQLAVVGRDQGQGWFAVLNITSPDESEPKLLDNEEALSTYLDSCLYDADGNVLVVGGGYYNDETREIQAEFYIYNTTSGDAISLLKRVELPDEYFIVNALLLDNQQRRLFVAAYPGVVIYNVTDWRNPQVEQEITLRGGAAIYSIALSRDEQRLVLGGNKAVLHFYNYGSGQALDHTQVELIKGVENLQEIKALEFLTDLVLVLSVDGVGVFLVQLDASYSYRGNTMLNDDNLFALGRGDYLATAGGNYTTGGDNQFQLFKLDLDCLDKTTSATSATFATSATSATSAGSKIFRVTSIPSDDSTAGDQEGNNEVVVFAAGVSGAVFVGAIAIGSFIIWKCLKRSRSSGGISHHMMEVELN